MTPKEKAKELVNKFNNIIPRECDGLENITSEFCALTAVDELIDNVPNSQVPYWIEVKREIDNL